MKYKILFLATCLCIGQTMAQRQMQTNRRKALPLDPAIKTGKLANGFTYFIRKNNEPQQRATLYLVVKAGSILENENQLGLAHFMEHMSFNGTKHFPKNELVEYLQRSGIRFGADLNAYTSFDETVYQLPIPTDDQKLFNSGLQIMRDWANDATLDNREINSERGVVLEEKRLRKGAQNRLQDKAFPFQVNNSRYGQRMPIGTEQVLTTFQKPAIESFYKDWYRPDLEALIVVGDIDIPKVEQQIRALFSDMKNPAREKERTEYRANLLNRPRFLSLTDPELSQTSVELDFKCKSLQQGSLAAYKESLIRNLCSQLLSERLGDIGRTPGAPVLNLQGGYSPVINGLDAITVEFTAKDKQLKGGFDLVYNALQQVKAYGFSQGAIDRAKTAYLSQMQALLREKDKQSSTALADELKRHFLAGEPAPGIAYETQLVETLLPQITAATINTTMATLLNDTNRDILITAPAANKASLPDEGTVNAWIKTLQSTKPATYQEQADQNALIAQEPVPGTILSETKDAGLGLTTWKLSNGATVVLKPSNFKNDEILFSAFSPGGTSLYSNADYESAANAAGMISAFGLGNHDATSLPKLLTGKQVQVQPYIAERSEGFHGGAAKADLPTALQLLYLYFTSPRQDSARYNDIKARSAEMIASRYSNPQAVFQDTVSAVMGNYDPRRTGPSQQKLDQISLSKVVDIYKERFANAGDFTFIFTGSFTPEDIRPMILKYIASLPGNGIAEQAKDSGIRIPRGHLTKSVYAGSEDKATVLLVYHGDYTFSPEEQVKLLALQDIIGFHLIERLRETEGGAYAPSVRFQREHGPGDRYQLVINFGCSKANVDRLIKATKEEIAKIRQNGPTADDLQKFKAEESRQLELSLKNNRYWISYLSTKLQNGEDLHSLDSQQQRIQNLDGASIRTAANQYIQEDNLIEFTWLPKE